MLIGPVLYLYFSSVQRPSASWHANDIVHPLFGLVLITLLFTIRPLRFLIDYAILSSFSTYLLFIALKMRSASAPLSHLGNHASAARQWLLSLCLTALINFCLEFAVVIEMQQGTALKDTVSLLLGSIAFVLINTLTILAALSRSHWLEWMYEFEEIALQRTASSIDTDLAKVLFQRWETLVNAEKLHLLEFGITLPQAAKNYKSRHVNYQMPLTRFTAKVFRCI